MEVATTTTEAHLSAIHQSLLQISATLGRMLTYGCVNATSSPDAVVPAKCSTVGLNPNIGAVEVVDSSQQSGIVSTVNPGLVGAPPSSTMQRFGILKSGKHTPTTCSTGVLSCPRDLPGARALDIDTDMSAEVLTHVGGLSLFQELERDYVDEVLNDSPLKDVLWYEELADCVVTHIGRPSLFLEKIMETHLSGERRLAHALTGLFSPVREASEIGHCMLTELLPWSRNGFSPGFYVQPYLGTMPPWMHRGFSPGVSSFIFITESRLFALTFWIHRALGEFPVIVHIAQFDVSSRGEVNLVCLPIILATCDTSSVEQLALYKCIFYVATAAVCILLNLTLGDVFCLIWKIFRSAVSSGDMIHKLYLGNNIQFYEGLIGTVAHQHNFHVNNQYTVQLYGHLLLGCRCLASVSFESPNLHKFQVANPFDFQCSMEMLVTYQSVQIFQVYVSLFDEAITATSFELEVKASRKMYWPSYPGIWSKVYGVTHHIAQEETETRCGASRSENSIHDTAASLAFVHFIWQNQMGQWDSFFQEEMVHMHQQADSRCYCHLQSMLLGFTIYQLCDMSTPDGIPWDPGGIIESRVQAIAWGQAMFCRGGSVTPDIYSGLGLGCLCVYMGLAQLVSTGSKDKGHTKQRRKTWNKKQNRSLDSLLCPVRLFSASSSSVRRLPQAPVSLRVPSSRRDPSSPATGSYRPSKRAAAARPPRPL